MAGMQVANGYPRLHVATLQPATGLATAHARMLQQPEAARILGMVCALPSPAVR